MGLFSVFKRRPVRSEAESRYAKSFSSYKSPRLSSRKPFVPKINSIDGSRINRRRSQKFGLFFFYLKILAGLAALGGILYLIFLTSLFEIQSVEVKGEADTAAEQTAIKEELQKYLGENLLFFGASDEETKLLENFAYLKTLEIHRNFFHTITVVVETYPAVANVRMEFDDGSEEYYIVNEKGFIAGIGTTLENLPLLVMDVTGTDMELPMEEPDVPVETPITEKTEITEETEVSEETMDISPEPSEELEPVSTHPNQINQELIPQETLQTLLDTATSFEGKFDMQILEIRYLKRARELHLYTERMFSVWIDLTQDVNLQLEKLKKSLNEIHIYEWPIEYIDLRISGQNGEKVIYKLAE